jgi:nitroreductase
MRSADSNQLDPMFLNRWSPRSFLKDPIPEKDIDTIFEAARRSPSCFNEQPWFYVYSTDTGPDSIFAEGLVPANRIWAAHAPLIVYVFSKSHFKANGKVNAFADFDTGASWMALCFQAEKLGYRCHAMGGIDKAKIYEFTKLPEDKYNLICGLVIGKQGPKEALSEDNQSKEKPSPRNAVSDFVQRYHLPI